MAEKLQAYLIYDAALDEEAKIEVLKRIYELPATNSEKSVEEVVRQHTQADHFRANIEYGSPLLTIDFDPYIPDNVPEVNCITVELNELDFMPSKFGDEHVENAVADYIEFIVEIYGVSCEAGIPTQYVIGADSSQVDALHGRFEWETEITRDGLTSGTVEQVFWLQILPPETIEALGRDHVLSAPAARVEELDDGAVLLVAYERPYPPGDPTELAEHLGVDARQYVT